MNDALNFAQQEAVRYRAGPCLVLAGAGSGKTKVITHKIAHLIDSGAKPNEVLAITFTNKAATEMRNRIRSLIKKSASPISICTFHAWGVHFLREHGQAAGIKPQFSIVDTHDALHLIKECSGSVDLASAKRFQWEISQLKNKGVGAQQALHLAQTEEERITALVMQRYEEKLLAFQSVDFDDLIVWPLHILTHHESIREKVQSSLKHILIDEYQDTNVIQYECLRQLTKNGLAFTAVGDDDQSIYGWRGATLDNLKRLPSDYPNLKIIKLEQNYRSTTRILHAANAVIGSNPKLFPKKLWSELGDGEDVYIAACDHEDHEATRALMRIEHLRHAYPSFAQWRDFAILYRTNHQSRAFETALRKAQIPYKVSGGQSFFERTEIKDLCAWIRLLVNQDDDPAFIRAVSTPKRGVGHQTLQQLASFAALHHLSLFEALFSHSLHTALSARAIDHLHEFGRYINDLEFQMKHAKGKQAAQEVLEAWLRDIGYQQHLVDQEDNPKAADQRWGNVQDFCQWMASRCGDDVEDPTGLSSGPSTLIEVAQTLALISTLSEKEKDANVLTLSTLHAAKGLEWSHVILAGINEGTLPFVDRHGDNDDDPDFNAKAIEEERRLMYVGITRAKKTLMVSWTKKRKKGRELVSTQPSRFIQEMSVDVVPSSQSSREKIRALREEFLQRSLSQPSSSKKQD